MYSPVNEKNAIDTALFVLLFESPFTDLEMAGLRKASEDGGLIEHFKQRQDLNVQYVALNFGQPGGSTPPPPPPPPAGFVYRDFSRSGKIAWEIKVDANNILVRCGDYTRWNEVIIKVRLVFNALLPAVSNKRIFKVIHTCVDKFMFDGLADAYEFVKLFNPGSRYLNASSGERNPPWHLHQGCFKPYKEYGGKSFKEERVLDALNVSTVVVGGRVDTIVEQVNELGLNVPEESSSMVDSIFDIFELMHVHNKKVILNVLSEDALRRIGLEG